MIFQYYQKIRDLLFLLPPEYSHKFALNTLNLLRQCGYPKTILPSSPVKIMGLTFPNAVGFAAGLDKNAEFMSGLFHLGVGFLEVGSVTPQARTGNPSPRLFRLPEYQALINRMGLPNHGIEKIIPRLKNREKTDAILGVNLSKNMETTTENTPGDYEQGIQAIYDYADYITINISCPHEKDLRHWQLGKPLADLLYAIKKTQNNLAQSRKRYVPLVVKLSPDLTQAEIFHISKTLLIHEIDGVIASNTTTKRDAIADSPYVNEIGGLSGRPLFSQSLQCVTWLTEALENKIPIIATGGIDSAARALQMKNAGASLIQVYTGFIYQGPQLLKDIAEIYR